ncbi:ASCH domain-containing protein [Flavobacterium crassostreae]|uniref:ASCH domain-containing protein n=1 Tax=Flavobacterium crassostreae TaxID=1763534 RepID=A0A1B9E7U6_9FLAO|nr:ASCH domain-containing protein [Flavobacterium crassostreae]OCB77981.1 hypothetical protein LPBF_03265 [Flavobacterium crassostreae]
MKALSIKQPWASLIAHGIKNIENRTWKTNFRGRIYLHASAKDAGALYELLNQKQIEVMSFHWTAAPPFPDRPVSAIIGEVDIIDCVINHPSIWAEITEIKGKTIEGELMYAHKPIYNWVLANPVLYDKPILNIKGKLSFWEPIPNQNCMSCDKKFFGQDAQYCCSGNECGCMGQPVEPVVCSEECYNKLFNR